MFNKAPARMPFVEPDGLLPIVLEQFFGEFFLAIRPFQALFKGFAYL